MQELEKLRQEIDEIDQKIISLIGQRFVVVKKIGGLKRENGLNVYDQSRSEEVARKWEEAAGENGFSAELAKVIYEQIHGHSLKLQQ